MTVAWTRLVAARVGLAVIYVKGRTNGDTENEQLEETEENQARGMSWKPSKEIFQRESELLGPMPCLVT